MHTPPSTPQDIFESDPELYDALFDWPRRLANEEPLYRRLFRDAGVSSVLDAACGTGRHAAMFHSWGLRVEGADVSRAMIDYCRSRYAPTETLRWVERPFDKPPGEPATFDAVLCLGNSLALADSVETFRRSVGAMLGAVRRSGVLVIQLLNIWRLPDGLTMWQKGLRWTRSGRELVLLKGVRRDGSRASVELVEIATGEEPIELRSDTPRLLGIEVDDLISTARKAGGRVEVFGDFHGKPYERAESPDILLVVTKG